MLHEETRNGMVKFQYDNGLRGSEKKQPLIWGSVKIIKTTNYISLKL